MTAVLALIHSSLLSEELTSTRETDRFAGGEIWKKSWQCSKKGLSGIIRYKDYKDQTAAALCPSILASWGMEEGKQLPIAKSTSTSPQSSHHKRKMNPSTRDLIKRSIYRTHSMPMPRYSWILASGALNPRTHKSNHCISAQVDWSIGHRVWTTFVTSRDLSRPS